MARQTSIDTYHEIKESGLLSKRRWEVYDIVYHFGPCSCSQMMVEYQKKYGYTLHSGSLGTRLSELRNIGVVTEMGEMICPVSGRNVIRWAVTKKLPIKWEKPIKHKCKACNGKGFFLEQQTKLF